MKDLFAAKSVAATDKWAYYITTSMKAATKNLPKRCSGFFNKNFFGV